MKRRSLIAIALLLSGLSATLGQNSTSPTASITVHVINEEGKPLSNAKSGGAFEMPKASGLGVESVARGNLTNSEGLVSSVGETSDGFVFCGATKEGYYRTANIKYAFKEKKENRWLPWNPTVEVVLKRIVKPIAMYAKHVETKIPVDASSIGYDLQIGDWVAPYGKGVIGDFIFVVNRKINNDRDFQATLQLSFSNKSDGVLPQLDAQNGGSELLLPRTAPENGYERERIWSKRRSMNGNGSDVFLETPCTPAYYFRIRTVLDETGVVKSALYGKIYQDVRLYAGTKAPQAGRGFTYYLNPTPNDRNVEILSLEETPHREALLLPFEV